MWSHAVEAARLRVETRTWRERLDAVFERIGDMVLVFNGEGKLALTNAAAGEFLRPNNFRSAVRLLTWWRKRALGTARNVLPSSRRRQRRGRCGANRSRGDAQGAARPRDAGQRPHHRVGSYEDRQRLVVEAPEWVPAVLADRERVERAITNLLVNALEYSAADKPVLIQVGQQEKAATIRVADQGVGIPPEDLPHVFKRHFRATTAGKREGLGLGLYITRLIAEAHGGGVYVESEVGKGSTFYFTLPLP